VYTIVYCANCDLFKIKYVSFFEFIFIYYCNVIEWAPSDDLQIPSREYRSPQTIKYKIVNTKKQDVEKNPHLIINIIWHRRFFCYRVKLVMCRRSISYRFRLYWFRYAQRKLASRRVACNVKSNTLYYYKC